MELESKTCIACGTKFYRRSKDYGKKWTTRKVCGLRCVRIVGNKAAVAVVSRPLSERLWEKVDKSGGKEACWLWTGSRNKEGGYGVISINKEGKLRTTHRVAWELTYGQIPEGSGYHGTCVLHRCDNPICCNPEHLFLGTIKDNARDMAAKGRGTHVRISEEEVSDIRNMYSSGKFVQAALGEAFGISQNTVSRIVNKTDRWKV